MATTLSANEEAQLLQTIEMFEVIAQSQPNDYQSLEILKEAYSKLTRVDDVVNTTKRIAKAYEASGQISSAILEYESILELRPDDPDVKQALGDIVNRANSFAARGPAPEADYLGKPHGDTAAARTEVAHARKAAAEIDDGRDAMRKMFVDGKMVSASDFDQLWVLPDLEASPSQVLEPFIHVLADKQIVRIEESLKLLCERSRLCYLPLEKYDLDIELVRSFPRDACQRWCVLPFDRMSKSILVATANPFNRQAAEDLKGSKDVRLIWYLAAPQELLKLLRKVFR